MGPEDVSLLEKCPHFREVMCADSITCISKQVLREVFHYHPRLTKEQFLTVGYVERKLQMVTDLLVACQDKHRQLSGTQRNGRRRGRAGDHDMLRSAH